MPTWPIGQNSYTKISVSLSYLNNQRKVSHKKKKKKKSHLLKKRKKKKEKKRISSYRCLLLIYIYIYICVYIYIVIGLFQNLWESPFAYILVLVVTHNSKNSNDHMHPYLIFPLNFISMEMWIPWKQLVIYNYRSFSQLRNIYWIFNKVIKIPSFNTSLKKNKNYNSFDVNPFLFVLPPPPPPFFFWK